MHFYNQLRRIERIDSLIRLHATGSPHELAARLQISPSQLYQTIKFMKEELEAPVYYSRDLNSYCYHGHTRFICTYV